MTSVPSDRGWIASLPAQLERQQQAMSTLLGVCERTPLVTSFSVGCSIGRHAADALSDVDAAIGVDAPRGAVGAAPVRAVESALVELLPRLGGLVDVLREESRGPDRLVRRVFAQFDDRLQLDLAVVAEPEVRRGEAAPDFVPLYWSGPLPAAGNGPSAREVSAEQVRTWTFLAWRALLDADKYLRRGSMWEAHHRLNETRDLIWRLWATAQGAAYPWHGLSQVLDDDPAALPHHIEATVAGLDAADLRRAVAASADVLDRSSAAAARAVGLRVRPEMADYARRTVRD
jgi:hypothetical protein